MAVYLPAQFRPQEFERIKPPQGAVLDWRHPLAKGLQFYLPLIDLGQQRGAAGFSVYEHVSRLSVFPSSATLVSLSTVFDRGPALNFTGAANSGIVWKVQNAPQQIVVPTTDIAFTLAVKFRATSFAIGLPMIIGLSDAGNNSAWSIVGDSLNSNHLRWNVVSANIRTANAYNTGGWFTVFAVHVPGGGADSLTVFDANGVFLEQAVGATGAIATSGVADFKLAGESNINSDFYSGAVEWAGVWNGALDMAAMQTMATRPYVLLQRPSRRWIGYSAAGGSTLSGAGLSQSDSTCVGVGTSTAAGAATSLAQSVCFAVGLAIISAAGASNSDSFATAPGTGITSGIGASTSQSEATATGATLTLVSAAGVSTAQSTAQAPGTSTVQGTGQSVSQSTATAAQTSTAQGAGASQAGASAAGGGAAIVTGAGASTSQSTVTAVGIAQTPGVFGISTSQSLAFGVGVSVVAGAGSATAPSTAKAAGSSTAAGSGAATAFSTAGGISVTIIAQSGRSIGYALVRTFVSTIVVYPLATFTPDLVSPSFAADAIQTIFAADDLAPTFTPDIFS